MRDDEDLILNTTARALDDATPQDLPRPHLGMSQIGKPDERALWLSFRWSLPQDTEPRVRRIFRLGHVVEGEVIELLSRIPGVTVHDRDPASGKQFNFSFCHGHFGGSMDGVIKGIPEAPNTWHVLEIKTVNSKRFKELQKLRVEAWSPEYYAQMQCYMGAAGLDRALFVAYNKDTSEIYFERIKREAMAFDGYLARAERIINATEIPPSIYSGKDDIEAKKAYATSRVYWGDELPPPNCRNCRSASPVKNGQWKCGIDGYIPVEKQRIGCNQHNYMPCFMPKGVTVKATYSECIEYVTQDGVTFWNAESGAAGIHQDVYSSKELCALSKGGYLPDVLNDAALKQIRTQFEAEIIDEPA